MNWPTACHFDNGNGLKPGGETMDAKTMGVPKKIVHYLFSPFGTTTTNWLVLRRGTASIPAVAHV
jgi:hypothetical protein